MTIEVKLTDSGKYLDKKVKILRGHGEFLSSRLLPNAASILRVVISML